MTIQICAWCKDRENRLEVLSPAVTLEEALDALEEGRSFSHGICRRHRDEALAAIDHNKETTMETLTLTATQRRALARLEGSGAHSVETRAGRVTRRDIVESEQLALEVLRATFHREEV